MKPFYYMDEHGQKHYFLETPTNFASRGGDVGEGFTLLIFDNPPPLYNPRRSPFTSLFRGGGREGNISKICSTTFSYPLYRTFDGMQEEDIRRLRR